MFSLESAAFIRFSFLMIIFLTLTDNYTACLKTATFSPDSTDLGEKYQMLKVLASVATTSASSQLLFD